VICKTKEKKKRGNQIHKWKAKAKQKNTTTHSIVETATQNSKNARRQWCSLRRRRPSVITQIECISWIAVLNSAFLLSAYVFDVFYIVILPRFVHQSSAFIHRRWSVDWMKAWGPIVSIEISVHSDGPSIFWSTEETDPTSPSPFPIPRPQSSFGFDPNRPVVVLVNLRSQFSILTRTKGNALYTIEYGREEMIRREKQVHHTWNYYSVTETKSNWILDPGPGQQETPYPEQKQTNKNTRNTHTFLGLFLNSPTQRLEFWIWFCI